MVKTGPKLELKVQLFKLSNIDLQVLSSAFLEKGEILLINPLGLEGDLSFRKAYDGFTYFGCKKSIKKSIRNQATNGKLTFGASDQNQFIQMGATGASMD